MHRRCVVSLEQELPSQGSHDGNGAGDCDREYLLVGWRPRSLATYPFTTREFARLMILRSRIEAHMVGADDREARSW